MLFVSSRAMAAAAAADSFLSAKAWPAKLP